MQNNNILIAKKTLKNFGENQNTLHISPGLFKKNRFEILLEKAT